MRVPETSECDAELCWLCQIALTALAWLRAVSCSFLFSLYPAQVM